VPDGVPVAAGGAGAAGYETAGDGAGEQAARSVTATSQRAALGPALDPVAFIGSPSLQEATDLVHHPPR
jgi:hypothetical protein